MPLPKENTYTTDYIYSLPEGQRAELIDGVIYDMAPPNRLHQKIQQALAWSIETYIRKNNGSCEVYPAPFAVFLNKDDDRGCSGAPDWVIEIASLSTKRTDYGVKLFKYRSAGVREYWIVNPLTKTVNVYDLKKEELSDQYSFDDDIQVCIYDNLMINIAELLK